MATSQVAVNRIFNARDDGRPIPEGWGVDAAGRTTTDPAAVAAAVPLGGYKGYGLAIMVEMLSGVLTGAGVGHGVGRLYGDPACRRTSATSISRSIRARSPATDSPSGSPACSPPCRRCVPGRARRGARARGARGAGGRRARRHGIPLPPFVWGALREAGDALGASRRRRELSRAEVRRLRLVIAGQVANSAPLRVRAVRQATATFFTGGRA